MKKSIVTFIDGLSVTNKKIKKVIFLGRKIGAFEAVKYLLKKNIEIAAIVGVEADPTHLKLSKEAEENKIPFFKDDSPLYTLIKSGKMVDIDLVISYLYPKKIKYPLISLGKIGCINFHPAPLPDYKGSAGYNIAILEGRKIYGVSVHFIDSEELDQGPIIKIRKFPVSEKENALSLYEKTQVKLLELFKETINIFESNEDIKTYKNKGGLSLNREQLEKLKEIDLKKDNLETINKKIRAFFFPPYTGAKIKVGNQDITLINGELLNYLDQIIKK